MEEESSVSQSFLVSRKEAGGGKFGLFGRAGRIIYDRGEIRCGVSGSGKGGKQTIYRKEAKTRAFGHSLKFQGRGHHIFLS